MKIYEIKTSRSRWTSLVIAVLLIVMVAMMCMPYFNYGKDASTYTSAAGNASHLTGTWVISGTDPETDGYKEIEFVDAKNFKARTTNIIRVNQNDADEAVVSAIDAYNAAVEAVKVTDIANKKVQEYAKVLADAKAYLDSFTVASAKTEGLSFEYFESEVEGLEVAIPENAPFVYDEESIAAVKAEAAKSYTKLEKAIKDAKDNYDKAVVAMENAKNDVLNAVAGATKAYEADASYALVTEDFDAFVKAFDAANPEVRESIVKKNKGDVAAYEAGTKAYEEALALTDAAKKAYDDLKKAADAKIATEIEAKSEADANAEKTLKDMKAENDKATKDLKGAVEGIGKDYIAAIEAVNAEISAIVDEYYNAATPADAAVYNKKIADLKAAKASVVADALTKYNAEIASNAEATEVLKAQYEADVAAQKADNEAAVAAATEALNAAVKTVENEYSAANAEYKELKKKSDALKKAIPGKVASMSEAEIKKAISEIAAAKEISEDQLKLLGNDFEASKESLDNKVYETLAAEKAKAAEGYALSMNVVKNAEKIMKAADKLTKSNGKEANKPVENFIKEFDKYVAAINKLDAAKTYEMPDVSAIVAGEIAAFEIPTYEKTSDVAEIIETDGTYKIDKKNVLTLTFKSGEVVSNTFTTEIGYNGVQELSILGYVGFPYDVEPFTEEMSYKIFGYNINDVVLVPIILLVLAVLGVVFCYIKKDKMSAAYLPAAFGIVGLIGYATSDFLKLGTKFTTHMIFFAVILVLAGLHIFFSVKEKKAK